MSAAELHAAVHAAVTARLELARAATPGPWELGDVWCWAGVLAERFGEGRCAYCHLGEPVVVAADMAINGRRTLGHVHRSPDPYEPTRAISGADHTLVLIPGDSGPNISEPDAAHIAANDPAATIRACEADLERLAEHKPTALRWSHWECPRCDDDSPCAELLRVAGVYAVAVEE